jgi:Mn2+/Fe2+ NRAMP family transporter
MWAGVVALLTAVMLVAGRYNLVQSFSTAIVSLFTLVTVINLFLLQSHATWSVTWSDIANGMSFRLPPPGATTGLKPVATALATFGIIGVGAAELVAYPYWCLEKGYARFSGPRNSTAEWGARARGWMRVMRWDVWGSMVVYTFATIAFYLLGAAVLGRAGLNPKESELVRTLNVMYEPVFGVAAQALFLFGAFAVLYSTFFVANAGHARVFPDALRVLRGVRQTPEQYQGQVKLLSGVFPLACLVIYILWPRPIVLVLLSGVMQAIMLPMLAFAALFFRYRRGDARLTPGRLWDVCLWVSAAGMFVAGVWTFFSNFGKLPAAIEVWLGG